MPSIILCQNQKKLTHAFASEDFGFKNLGLGRKTSAKDILTSFKELVINSKKRQAMKAKMANHDIPAGRHNIIALLKNICAESLYKNIDKNI